MGNNEIQIRQLVENWAAAVCNHDINGILANHSADMVMYDVPGPFQSVGIDAYRDTWNIFFKYTRSGVFDILDLHITAGEDVAFCFAKMRCDDNSNSADYTPLDFRLTIGFKKVGDKWMITHEHHSVPAT